MNWDTVFPANTLIRGGEHFADTPGADTKKLMKTGSLWRWTKFHLQDTPRKHFLEIGQRTVLGN